MMSSSNARFDCSVAPSRDSNASIRRAVVIGIVSYRFNEEREIGFVGGLTLAEVESWAGRLGGRLGQHLLAGQRQSR